MFQGCRQQRWSYKNAYPEGSETQRKKTGRKKAGSNKQYAGAGSSRRENETNLKGTYSSDVRGKRSSSKKRWKESKGRNGANLSPHFLARELKKKCGTTGREAGSESGGTEELEAASWVY